jgi:hypothetical protein
LANYSGWNTEIAQYFISTAQEGIGVYLSVNEGVLVEIGTRMVPPVLEMDAVKDFVRSVRAEVVTEDGFVDLTPLDSLDPDGVPQGVAFLAAQVLAACMMAEDIEINANNYFERLNSLLGIQAAGRPPGMSPASENEQPLWDMWNSWLLRQGYLPTAENGSGPTSYIALPISQSLVRQADEDKLADVFDLIGPGSNPDMDILFYQVSRYKAYLTRHLLEMLNDPGTRYESLVDEIYTSWLDWKENGRRVKDGRVRKPRVLSSISLKLYRTNDPLEGVEYYLYPEMPRMSTSLDGISVCLDEHNEVLRRDRPGWWAPLSRPALSDDLDGRQFLVDGHPSLKTLRLEPRNFWILVHDQDDPRSGVRASWRRPTLGEPFTLLFRDSIISDLALLKAEVLIYWDGTPTKSRFDGWSEISNCSAISTAGWTGVFTKDSDLIQALRPIEQISIRLSGGLRLLEPLRWLASHPPEVSVVSPVPRIMFEVRDVLTREVIFESDLEGLSSAKPFSVSEWHDRPGTYLISARPNLQDSIDRSSATRSVTLVGWDELEPTLVTDPVTTPLMDPWKVNGAVLTDMEEL